MLKDSRYEHFIKIGCNHVAGFSAKEVELILTKLTSLEAQQRNHTQLLQGILASVQQQQQQDGCGEVPAGMSLPLSTIPDLFRLESDIQDQATAKSLVGNLITIVDLSSLSLSLSSPSPFWFICVSLVMTNVLRVF